MPHDLRQSLGVLRVHNSCPGVVPALSFFRNAPRLHTACIIHWPAPAENLALPWQQLRRVQLYHLEVADMLSVLKLCTQVDDIVLCQASQSDRDFDLALPSFSAKAKTLTLEIEASQHGVSVLEYLKMPALETLVLTGLDKDLDGSWAGKWTGMSVVGSFLRRSSCELTSFTLGLLPLTSSDVLTVLELMPKLAHLTLTEFHHPRVNRTVTPRLLMALVVEYPRVPPSSPSLLPHLTSLEFNVHCASLLVEVLDDICASRCIQDPTYTTLIGFTCLGSLMIRGIGLKSPSQHSLQSRFDPFRAAGLRFTVEREALEPLDVESDSETEEMVF
ncbi:hypothetical protein PQX77_018645 [Marasmius sp. AFHP31]|nr:hypothetical protein PQX77_018645 [Marasmius sp. AFHP31]